MLSHHITLIQSFPRFWSKVALASPDECWNWTAYSWKGYGQFRNAGRPVPAHRFAYELVIGPIPLGLQIDHLCRNRKCVNPNHLEPVTQQENIRRGLAGKVNNWLKAKTHCLQGHPYDDVNTLYRPPLYKHRSCRACKNRRSKEYWKRRTAAATIAKARGESVVQ